MLQGDSETGSQSLDYSWYFVQLSIRATHSKLSICNQNQFGAMSSHDEKAVDCLLRMVCLTTHC